MDWFVKAFLTASLAWLGAGVSLGVAMAVHPAWAVYRTAHLHMNMLGFVAMMLFGVWRTIDGTPSKLAANDAMVSVSRAPSRRQSPS